MESGLNESENMTGDTSEARNVCIRSARTISEALAKLHQHLVQKPDDLDSFRNVVRYELPKDVHTAIRTASNGIPILHMALQARASLDIIKFMHQEWPQAAVVEEPCYHLIPFLSAVVLRSSLEIVEYLSQQQQQLPMDLSTLMDKAGNNPLHLALAHSVKRLTFWQLKPDCAVPKEDVVELLVKMHPPWLKQCNKRGMLPFLTAACNMYLTPRIARILLEAYPDSIRATTLDGRIPLHLVLSSRVCEQDNNNNNNNNEEDQGPIAPNQRELVELMVSKYTESVRVEAQGSRNLPIHYAASSDTDVPTLDYLYTQWPESIKQTNRYGDLPVNLVAIFCKWDKARYLTDKWPESVHCTNRRGLKPIECINWEHHANGPLDGRYLEAFLPKAYPIHFACSQSRITTLAVMRLLRSRGAGGHALILERDDEGKSPLQRAVEASDFRYDNSGVVRYLISMCNSDHSVGTTTTTSCQSAEKQNLLHLATRNFAHANVVQMLLEHCGAGGLMEVDSDGNLPIHLALRDLSSPTNDSFILSERQAKWFNNIGKTLVVAAPLCVKYRSGGMMYPLSLATKNAGIHLSSIELLVHCWPSSGEFCKDADGYLPWQSAAIGNHSIEVIYYLVREWPSVVTIVS